MKKNLKYIFMNLIVAFILFYITLPSINIMDINFYIYLIEIVLSFTIIYLIDNYKAYIKIKIEKKIDKFKEISRKYFQNELDDFSKLEVDIEMDFDKKFKEISLIKKIKKIVKNKFNSDKIVKNNIKILTIIALFLGINAFISLPFFNAKKYSGLIKIKNRDFSQVMDKIEITQLPILDEETAVRLGNTQLGNINGLASQFSVWDKYTQISIENKPIKVSPLKYQSFIKWLANKKRGIEYYIKIDMISEDVKVVKLEKAIMYSPSDYFNKNLKRHLRFKHPTYMFESCYFEIRDDNIPYFIVPIYKYRIGIFGGKDISKIIVVNANTGKDTVYNTDDVPGWVDNVYPEKIIMNQLNYWGKYKDGFWNSILLQKKLKKTTIGHNIISVNSGIALYTGIVPLSNDKSNIGFVFVNKRTKNTIFVPINGADEYSAMKSAEAEVQNKGYKATFPTVININYVPTYFLSLKGNDGLVKEYAFISVERYEIVGSGDTLDNAMKAYIHELEMANIINKIDIKSNNIKAKGKVEKIIQFLHNENLEIYIFLEYDNKLYEGKISENKISKEIEIGDKIELSYKKILNSNRYEIIDIKKIQ